MFQIFAIVVSLALTAVTVVVLAQAVRTMLGVLRQGQTAGGPRCSRRPSATPGCSS